MLNNEIGSLALQLGNLEAHILQPSLSPAHRNVQRGTGLDLTIMLLQLGMSSR